MTTISFEARRARQTEADASSTATFDGLCANITLAAP
jgi:hypothetical protein